MNVKNKLFIKPYLKDLKRFDYGLLAKCGEYFLLTTQFCFSTASNQIHSVNPSSVKL